MLSHSFIDVKNVSTGARKNVSIARITDPMAPSTSPTCAASHHKPTIALPRLSAPCVFALFLFSTKVLFWNIIDQWLLTFNFEFINKLIIKSEASSVKRYFFRSLLNKHYRPGHVHRRPGHHAMSRRFWYRRQKFGRHVGLVGRTIFHLTKIRQTFYLVYNRSPLHLSSLNVFRWK